MKTRIGWPAALIVAAMITGIVVLAAMGRPVGELIGFGTVVLGALFYGQLQGVRDQANGNTSRQLDMIERLSDRLSAQSLAIQAILTHPSGESVDTQRDHGNADAETVGTQGNPGA